MKKLIIAILVFLLFACSDEYVLHANLTEVSDKIKVRTDEMDNDYFIRTLIPQHFDLTLFISS